MAKITSSLDIQLDLTRPVEELAQVISAVLMSSPRENHKSILEGLDIEIGNALASLEKEKDASEPNSEKE